MAGLARSLGCVVLLALVAAGCRSGAEPGEGTGPEPRGCVARLLGGDDGPGCRGVRVRFPNPQLVPQGLALGPDRTAYVSGYDYEPQPGHRESQVARVGRRTGKVLAFGDMFEGSAPGEFCRHGGGVALDRHGLWLAGAGRVWLLDPALLGSRDEVLRVWQVDDTIRASTIAVAGEELVIGCFHEHRRGWALRFRVADLLDPAATTLDAATGGGGVEPVRARRVPSQVQGIAVSGGRAWLTRSTSYCGELVRPSGHRVPFLPGAEGLAFDRAGWLWTVSESGSRPYQRMGGRPDVPTLTRIDPRRLDRRRLDRRRLDRRTADCW